MTVNEEKKACRRAAKEALKALAPEWREAASLAIGNYVCGTQLACTAKCVFCYVSTAQEPDTISLIKTMLQMEKDVCVPRCESSGVMTARRITVQDALQPGMLGILEPPETAEIVSPQQIDLAIIPGLAFTRSGVRLGHGGGYYDRFLAQCRGARMALCFAGQLQPTLPAEETDQEMDVIITEQETILCMAQA